MDTRSVEDHAAVWQARAVYREEYELNEKDVELEEVQAAHQQYQEAWGEYVERAGEHGAAVHEESSALHQVLRPADSSRAVRENNERWARAREDLKRAKAAHLEAKERWETTRKEYVRVLFQYF